MAALACALLMRGLQGLAALFEGLARLIRLVARPLERAVAGARARASLPLVADAPAPTPDAVPVADQTIVAADKAVIASDKTIVAAPAFLAPSPPALPPPPKWGRGPVLPPPRRSEWRAAMKSPDTVADTSQSADTVQTRSEG